MAVPPGVPELPFADDTTAPPTRPVVHVVVFVPPAPAIP